MRSEEEAFRLLLYALVVIGVLIVIALLLRALL